jgi:hypothetical protein
MRVYDEDRREPEEIVPGEGIGFTDEVTHDYTNQYTGHKITITNTDKPSLKDAELSALCNVVGSLMLLVFGFYTLAVLLNFASLFFIIKAIREIR